MSPPEDELGWIGMIPPDLAERQEEAEREEYEEDRLLEMQELEELEDNRMEGLL